MIDNGTQTSNSRKKDSGSPQTGEPVYLAVGRLGKPHGIQGEIVLHVITDFPERLRPGKIVHYGEKHIPLKIKSSRNSNKGIIVSFDEYLDINQISELRNQYLYVNANTLPVLPPGEYYHHQLIGLVVKNETGQELGILEEILETGANDVYVVKNLEGGEELIPALKQNILSIDLSDQIMVVKQLEYYNQD